jgi:hypothetical protein
MFSVCSSINARPMQPASTDIFALTLTFAVAIGQRGVAAREI